jgi:ATP-binding cassette subfamily C (CFTR/MRP) protein 1
MTTIVGLAISSLATPFIWAAVVPVFYVFWNIQNMYRKTARELKRLSSIARSPIFAHFNETITSLTTVRAFEQEERLIIKNDMNNDKFGRAMLAQNVCFRWLAIRLNSMSTMLTSLVTTWICLHPDQLDPGLTAMVITYSLQVTGYLQWLINTFTQLEIEMNSCARHTPHATHHTPHAIAVGYRSYSALGRPDTSTNVASVSASCRIERVKHYSEIEVESAYTATDIVTAPRGWPTAGRIEFNRICARYRPELPLVIENVTFTVQSNEKVGVVGRTGSGAQSSHRRSQSLSS